MRRGGVLGWILSITIGRIVPLQGIRYLMLLRKREVQAKLLLMYRCVPFNNELQDMAYKKVKRLRTAAGQIRQPLHS